MNLHEATSHFRLQLAANGRSPHTIGQFDRHLRAFIGWLGIGGGEIEITAIDAPMVARFFTSDAARNSSRGGMKKPTSLNSMRSSIRNFFRFLHEAGLVTADPTRLIRRARCAAPPPRALSATDEAKLLAAMDATGDPAARRDRVLVRLLARTGLRISSALAIAVEDIDAVNGEIEIRESKGGQRDRIPVSESTTEMLTAFIGDRTSGPVFCGRDDHAIDRRHVARRLAHWATKAGIEQRVHPHAFRHGLAIRLLEAGHDLRLVQQALRHKSIASTTVYAIVADSRVRAALTAAERAG